MCICPLKLNNLLLITVTIKLKLVTFFRSDIEFKWYFIFIALCLLDYVSRTYNVQLAWYWLLNDKDNLVSWEEKIALIGAFFHVPFYTNMQYYEYELCSCVPQCVADFRLCSGWPLTWKPGKNGKVWEFNNGQGKVRETVFFHARNLANWFSGKSLKLLPPDVRFYSKFDSAGAQPQTPLGELTALP